MEKLRTTAAVACLFLTACGGGGGGGGVVSTPPAAFSFSDRQPNQTVTLEGVTAPVRNDGSGPVLGAHTSGSATLTFDGNRDLKTVSVTTPQASTSFDTGSAVCVSGGACAVSNATAAGVFIDPTLVGWNYQTFGVWAQEVGIGSVAGGGLSVGTRTPATGMPTTGNAVFTGLAGGLYSNSNGSTGGFVLNPGVYGVDATMRAEVNFGTRNIAFSTNNTLLTSLNDGAVWAVQGLNVSGQWSYASGSSSFAGSVNTANGSLAGSASGSFYGPSGQEIGGVYSLSRPGETMVGGFGGKR